MGSLDPIRDCDDRGHFDRLFLGIGEVEKLPTLPWVIIAFVVVEFVCG